jgi:heme-degrading monooxygenase HmoA
MEAYVMAYLLIHHTVEDYNKWKHNFDAHESARSVNGSRGGRVFCSANNPNEVFVLLEWDSIENAQKFAQSINLKEVMKNADVIGMPSIYFVEDVAKIST